MEDRTLDRISRSLAGATSRRQALKLLGGGIAAGALGTVGVSQASAQATGGGVTTPVTIPALSDAVELLVTSFRNAGGSLIAFGNVLDAVGDVLDTFSAPVTDATAQGCEILFLTLGPLELDVLGLVVTIPNPVVVDITAVPGAGNLLGNLLCAVANLLNGGGPLGAIAGLLNRILRILG